MRWNIRVATVADIPIYLHASFLLLLGIVVLMPLALGRPAASVAVSGLFLLGIFASVVVHEFGHALTARRFGVATRDVTLYPIGGVARLERMPERPMQEFWISIAGPITNVVIAAGLGVGVAAMAAAGLGAGPLVALLDRLIVANVVLAGFNLLPAFPMDGGRILRSLLALRLPYARSTEIAAAVGRAMALLLGVVGTFFNPMLIFIALFVWFGAGQEAGYVKLQAAMRSVPLRHLMATEYLAMSPLVRIRDAARLGMHAFHGDIPVVDAEHRLIGLLRRSDVKRALDCGDGEARVADVMSHDFVSADVRDSSTRVFTELATGRGGTVPIVAGERLVGIVTRRQLVGFMQMREAFASR